MATIKCRNCGSPHRSGICRCLARPTRLGAPFKEKIKTYRQAGEREYQDVLQTTAAEESAASMQIKVLEIKVVRSQQLKILLKVPKRP